MVDSATSTFCSRISKIIMGDRGQLWSLRTVLEATSLQRYYM